VQLEVALERALTDALLEVGLVSSLNVPTSTPVECFALARSNAATSSRLGGMSIG
jgi:hypothetical protein